MMAQPDSVTWIGDLFAAIDAKDTGRFVAFLTPQGEFRFGSSPPVRGREQVAAAVDGFFSTIAGLGHRVDRTWQVNFYAGTAVGPKLVLENASADEIASDKPGSTPIVGATISARF